MNEQTLVVYFTLDTYGSGYFDNATMFEEGPDGRSVEWKYDSWDDMMNDVGKAYVDALSSEFKIPLEYDGFTSPKEYNFETDRVFAKVSLTDVEALRESLDPEKVQDMAERMFTSYDGFISFYDPDMSTWGELSTWDHNQVAVLFNVLCEEEEIEFDDIWDRYHLYDVLYNHQVPCDERWWDWINAYDEGATTLSFDDWCENEDVRSEAEQLVKEIKEEN